AGLRHSGRAARGQLPAVRTVAGGVGGAARRRACGRRHRCGDPCRGPAHGGRRTAAGRRAAERRPHRRARGRYGAGAGAEGARRDRAVLHPGARDRGGHRARGARGGALAGVGGAEDERGGDDAAGPSRAGPPRARRPLAGHGRGVPAGIPRDLARPAARCPYQGAHGYRCRRRPAPSASLAGGRRPRAPGPGAARRPVGQHRPHRLPGPPGGGRAAGGRREAAGGVRPGRPAPDGPRPGRQAPLAGGPVDRTGHRPHLPGGPARRRVSVGPLAAPSGRRAPPGTIEPMRLLSTPSRLYRVLALAEVVTWTLLLGGMFVKYVLSSTELLVRIGGGLHGFKFLCYVVVTVLVAVDHRWKLTDLLLGIASAIIPYLTVPFERSAERRGLLGESWRLREEQGRTVSEKVVGLALRRPFPAALITIVAVAVVFSILLSLGPPTEWFA